MDRPPFFRRSVPCGAQAGVRHALFVSGAWRLGGAPLLRP